MDIEDLRPLHKSPQVASLYESVGGTAYTNDPRQLEAAINGSHLVILARDAGGSLIGLARTVSDGRTIVYLEDVLVTSTFQRAGVGGALLDEVLQRSRHIRQVVLLTDTEPSQRAFYESRGFVEAHDAQPNDLSSFIRLS